LPTFELLIVLGLILLNGFFAMSELAIVSSKPNRLQQMADGGSKGAERALALLRDPTGFLSTVQIGITLIGIFAGAYSGATFAEPLSGAIEPLIGLSRTADLVAFAIVVVVTTYLSLIIGELVPKRLALNNAERIASFVSLPMTIMAKVGLPLVFILRLSTNTVLRVLGVTGVNSPKVTEDDIRALIIEGVETGIVKRTEQEMIEGVMHVVDRNVRTIMVPRREIEFLDLDDAPEAHRATIRSAGHTRYPLCRGTIDEIVGVVHVKDLFDEVMPPLETVVREPLYVSEGMPVVRLIDTFKSSGIQMAIVLDEYGGVQGLVTPTDVLIAIAGDFVETGADDEPDAVQREDGSWLLDAAMPIASVRRVIDGFAVETDADFETLAGYLLDRLGHIPQTGEVWREYGWRFEIIDLDGLRIDKVLASRA
jgi:putative hemolysin